MFPDVLLPVVSGFSPSVFLSALLILLSGGGRGDRVIRNILVSLLYKCNCPLQKRLFSGRHPEIGTYFPATGGKDEVGSCKFSSELMIYKDSLYSFHKVVTIDFGLSG